MTLRLCGGDCPTPELAHREPEPDWIGNVPVMHGESDYPVIGTRKMFCLCGHPDYMMCPEQWAGNGLSGMTFERGMDPW